MSEPTTSSDAPAPEAPACPSRKPFLTARRWECALPALLLAGSLHLFVWGIGSYGLWDPWEPKYPVAVEEMRARGDYFTPYFDDEVRWTKPILIYWAMLVPMWIGGNNEFTARLPSAVAGILGVLAVYAFVRKLRGRRTAFLAACILGTLPQYFYMARQAMPDMLMTFFLTTAMASLALGRFGAGRKRLYFVLFYLSVGLAFLSKGPVAVVIVLGAVLLFWLVDADPARLLAPKAAFQDLRTAFRAYHVGIGIGLVALTAGPWYLYMVCKHGAGFFHNFVMYENLTRFLQAIRGHHGLATFYLRTMFHGMYPWTALLAPAAFFLFARQSAADEECRQRWYYLAWLLSPFLVFSIAGTKLQHYFLPAAPAVAVLTALVWEAYFEDDPPFWVRPVLLLSAVFLLLPMRDFLCEGNEYLLDNFTNKRTIKDADVEAALKFVFAGWTAAMALGFLLRRSRAVAALAVLTAYCNAAYFCHHVMPVHARRRNVKQYVDYYVQHRAADTVLAFYGRKLRSSLYYYCRRDRCRRFDDEDDVVDFAKQAPAAFIIVERKRCKSLMRRLSEQSDSTWRYVSGEHPRYCLITNQAEPLEFDGVPLPE